MRHLYVLSGVVMVLSAIDFRGLRYTCLVLGLWAYTSAFRIEKQLNHGTRHP